MFENMSLYFDSTLSDLLAKIEYRLLQIEIKHPSGRNMTVTQWSERETHEKARDVLVAEIERRKAEGIDIRRG